MKYIDDEVQGGGLGIVLTEKNVDHKGLGLTIGKGTMVGSPTIEKDIMKVIDEAVILKSNTIVEKDLALKNVHFTGDLKQKFENVDVSNNRYRKLSLFDGNINFADPSGKLLEWKDQESSTPIKRLASYVDGTSFKYEVPKDGIPTTGSPAEELDANKVNIEMDSKKLFSNNFCGIEVFFKQGRECTVHIAVHDDHADDASTSTLIATGSIDINSLGEADQDGTMVSVADSWIEIPIALVPGKSISYNDVITELTSNYHYHVYYTCTGTLAEADIPKLGTNEGDEIEGNKYAYRHYYMPLEGQSAIKIVDDAGVDITDNPLYEVMALKSDDYSSGSWEYPEAGSPIDGTVEYIGVDPCKGEIFLPTSLENTDLYAEFYAWIGYRNDELHVSNINSFPENELKIESEILNLQKPYVDATEGNKTLSFKVKVNDVDKSIDFYIEDAVVTP